MLPYMQCQLSRERLGNRDLDQSDADTGRFMQGKEDGAPFKFKGVAKEIDHRRKTD